MSNLQSLSLDTWRLEPEVVAGAITVRMSGLGDMAVVKPFADFLAGLKDEISSADIQRVEFDVRNVQLLNSSCLKSIFNFAFRIKAEHPSCQMSFLTSASQAWQARALGPIQRMVREQVTISAA
jgi:hypothetical protein